MPELAKPYPGWTPTRLGVRGECMRQAFCCAAGVHPIKVRYIDAADYSIDFWTEWEREFGAHGFRFQRATLEEAERWPGFWIAIVPSFYNGPEFTHAITMHGGKLHYDSSPKARKRRPNKFCGNPIIPVPR